MTKRELVVSDDIAETTAGLFARLRPRTLALAGGRTPRAVYERLAELEYDWSAVEVFFGDERCLPPDDPDSNFRMADEALLSRVAARVHRMRGESCDAAGYEEELRAVFGEGVPAARVAAERVVIIADAAAAGEGP